jgi:hypothetical protein
VTVYTMTENARNVIDELYVSCTLLCEVAMSGETHPGGVVRSLRKQRGDSYFELPLS